MIETRGKKIIGLISLAGFLSCFTSLVSAEGGRDPFAPYVVEEPVNRASSSEGVDAKERLPQKPPLERYPISSYRLIGVLIGPESWVALVRTPERKEYLLHLSDRLGSNNGVVVAIDLSGITVDEGGSRINLAVSNRLENSNENL